MRTVGVIGLGIMGSSYVRNLLKNGFSVVGYDLDRTRVSALEAEGMRSAASPCDVAR